MEEPQAEMEAPQITYTNDKMKLIGKLSKIMGEMGSVPKDGFNKFQNYSYVTEDALIREVRVRLSDAGLFIPVDVTEMRVTEVAPTSKGIPQYRTDVKTLHTITDSETGATRPCSSYGSGIDTGDKGVYKAVTGACKQFLMKNFMIPTGDDPEVENSAEQTTAPMSAQTAAVKVIDKKKTKAKPVEPKAAEQVEQITSPLPPEGSEWATVVHFGKCKDHTLAEIKGFAKESKHSLSKMWWYFTNKWEPQPFKDAISDTDLNLYKAINKIQGSTPKTVEELLGRTEIKDDTGEIPMQWEPKDSDNEGEPDF